MRILAAWWVRGSSEYSRSEIEATMLAILKEIAERVRAGKMRWTLHPERLKKSTRPLFRKLLKKLPEKDAKTLLGESREKITR